jgi:hypothetical protein
VAGRLESEGKFLIISYRKEIKDWLGLCCQACRADKVRSFLKDFIDYVNVMKETGMLSEQDLALVTNYVRERPALEEGLRSKFDDEWEITRVPASDLPQREGLGFGASKRQWQGRFAFSLCFEGSECTSAYFGIVKGKAYASDASDIYISGLKAKMDEGMGAGRQNRIWEWWSLRGRPVSGLEHL